MRAIPVVVLFFLLDVFPGMHAEIINKCAEANTYNILGHFAIRKGGYDVDALCLFGGDLYFGSGGDGGHFGRVKASDMESGVIGDFTNTYDDVTIPTCSGGGTGPCTNDRYYGEMKACTVLDGYLFTKHTYVILKWKPPASSAALPEVVKIFGMGTSSHRNGVQKTQDHGRTLASSTGSKRLFIGHGEGFIDLYDTEGNKLSTIEGPKEATNIRAMIVSSTKDELFVQDASDIIHVFTWSGDTLKLDRTIGDEDQYVAYNGWKALYFLRGIATPNFGNFIGEKPLKGGFNEWEVRGGRTSMGSKRAFVTGELGNNLGSASAEGYNGGQIVIWQCSYTTTTTTTVSSTTTSVTNTSTSVSSTTTTTTTDTSTTATTTTTITTITTSTSTSTITTTTTTSTTTLRGVNKDCDPFGIDLCNARLGLTCDPRVYKCRYITATTAPKNESSLQPINGGVQTSSSDVDPKCQAGEEFNSDTGDCTPCPPGSTMLGGQFDVCEMCPSIDIEYTVEGNVGTCAMLFITERTIAASQGTSDGADADDTGIDSGTLIGIIISVVIAGIGGVIMFLKSKKDEASQQVMLQAIHRSTSGVAGIMDSDNSKPAPTVDNPLYFGNGEA